MRLISREDVEALIRCDELSDYQFMLLDEKLDAIPDRAVLTDCAKCFGASFGDCDNCERVKEVKE